MNDERWTRVKKVFHEALKVHVDLRPAFLDATCGDDKALRAEVEELIVAHDEVGDDTSSAAPVSADAGVFPIEGPGTMIDRYKVLEQIGEGGMGVVYLAEQQKPIRRRVALKIIKLGMDTKEVIARFEAERQALAMMDHTNIARVFDAGTTELGRPYFVMEHVPGIPITEYCDQHRLNARERLQLYIPVCQAIHHAHQRAVIHRDVKPSNVLVMVQDGKPVPKVIDFGVAKATNQRLTEKTLFTGQGVLIGTPVYMSPEQAEMTGLNIDTTTDIYSLGAMLYELLAGAPPFDPKSLREAGLLAIHQMIREVEPVKPSTRFHSLGGEATTVAERRRTEPATLERQIRGDLDWITMRAMEKDRSRRYQSASEFAADIDRYLRNEPVEAGPPGTTYQMKKFMRRHKAGVGLAAAAIVVLIGFAATMTLQANRIARERDRAQFEASRSRVTADLVQAILLDEAHVGYDARVDEYVALSRESWEMNRRSLVENPGGLALTAVNTIRLLDFFDIFGDDANKTEVRRLIAELEPVAFDLIEQALAERDTTVLKTMALMLVHMRDQEKSAEQGEFIDIAPICRKAIALRRQIHTPGDPALIYSLTSFADLLEARGRKALSESRPADAEPAMRELLSLRLEVDKAKGKQAHAIATAKGFLGEALMELGRHAEAEPFLVESAEFLKTLTARNRLIKCYESWGKSAKAGEHRKSLIVKSVREVGVVADGSASCLSGLFGGRSVWVFTGFGASRWQQRWAWTNDTDASDGIALHAPGRYQSGNHELLPLTADEKAFNDAAGSADAGKWLVSPGPIVADPERNRAFVTYLKELAGPENKRVGWSIAVWEHPDSVPVRPVVRPGTAYPTLLFQGDEPGLRAGALVEDGFLYLYAANWTHVRVARAPLEDVLDRDAWRFYAGETAGEKWVRDWTRAANIAEGRIATIGTMSVSWNEHLQKYLVVSGFPASTGGGIVIRTADRPEGPWLSDEVILEGLPPRLSGNNGMMAHTEFARDGGRIQYMTYSHPTGIMRRDVRLLEVVLR
jgi:non-specific serine/threonine protein kinase/serine/threonine-protein kinase